MVKTDLFYLFICCLFVQCQAGKRFILFSVSQFVFIFFTNFKRDFFLTKIISAPDAVDIEISALTESMFQASTPNLFNEITVNLQRKTYSSSLVDDAPSPYVIYSHPFSIKMVDFWKNLFLACWLSVTQRCPDRKQLLSYEHFLIITNWIHRWLKVLHQQRDERRMNSSTKCWTLKWWKLQWIIWNKKVGTLFFDQFPDMEWNKYSNFRQSSWRSH